MSADFSNIYNYRQASPLVATSGQPKAERFKEIAAAGYEVVINLALHDDPRYSLPDEPGTVRAAGMTYIHIPVKFDHPTVADLETFFQAMESHKGRKLWVHCAANMRVTAFLGLYWAMREGQPHEQAFALMNDVWKPDKVWTAFISSTLEQRS